MNISENQNQNIKYPNHNSDFCLEDFNFEQEDNRNNNALKEKYNEVINSSNHHQKTIGELAEEGCIITAYSQFLVDSF